VRKCLAITLTTYVCGSATTSLIAHEKVKNYHLAPDYCTVNALKGKKTSVKCMKSWYLQLQPMGSSSGTKCLKPLFFVVSK